ncbi:MAG: hypothetical protein ACYS15_14820 [Planctomycetota bacterium]|jgi:Kef-type K+ transport system membrane component KefB
MQRAALTMVLGILVAAGLVAFLLARRGGVVPGSQVWIGLAVVGAGVVALAMVAVARMSRGAGASGSAAAVETAERLGLSYAAEADKDFRSRFRDLPEVPGNARIKHVLEGELDGRALVAFESSYMIYTGQTTIPVANTVYAIASPDWPKTHVTPRGLLSRLYVRLGVGSGLRLENPEFNARFSVKTDEEDFAIALLGPDMQAFMLTKARVRWRLGHGRVCLVYSGTLKPDRIEASLDRIRSFWTWVPRELEDW